MSVDRQEPADAAGGDQQAAGDHAGAQLGLAEGDREVGGGQGVDERDVTGAIRPHSPDEGDEEHEDQRRADGAEVDQGNEEGSGERHGQPAPAREGDEQVERAGEAEGRTVDRQRSGPVPALEPLGEDRPHRHAEEGDQGDGHGAERHPAAGLPTAEEEHEAPRRDRRPDEVGGGDRRPQPEPPDRHRQEDDADAQAGEVGAGQRPGGHVAQADAGEVVEEADRGAGDEGYPALAASSGEPLDHPQGEEGQQESPEQGRRSGRPPPTGEGFHLGRDGDPVGRPDGDAGAEEQRARGRRVVGARRRGDAHATSAAAGVDAAAANAPPIGAASPAMAPPPKRAGS